MPRDGAGIDAAALAALLIHIEPAYRDRCGKILRGEPFSFSQAWQDWYLFHNHFSERTTWGSGTYVDIGTNHPTQITNTLFFDKCLGWRGVCFEPGPEYHEPIRANRGCTLVPRCVVGGGKGEKQRLRKMEGTGNMARVVPAGPSESSAQSCVVASEAITPVLGNSSGIDLLNIDIEGMEPEVLRCFPFKELGVHAVLIETNRADQREACGHHSSTWRSVPRPAPHRAPRNRQFGALFAQVDRFFHRHGFGNDETFVNVGKTPPRGFWLDNLHAEIATTEIACRDVEMATRRPSRGHQRPTAEPLRNPPQVHPAAARLPHALPPVEDWQR
jgi:FkbM family methyltransferase